MGELYLITGANGHLGNTLIRKLLVLGKKVRALVLVGQKHIKFRNVAYCYGDVLDKKSLLEFFNNPKEDSLIVIHCAGIVSIASKYNQNVYDVNVKGTKNIVDLCEQNKVKKLVYVSSVHAIPEKAKGKVIGEVSKFNPDDVIGLYAKTKSEATAYVLAAAKQGLNASVVHPSGICGPYDDGKGHLTTLITDYYKGHLFATVNGGYDFVDVRDVSDGIIVCTEKGRQGECYILSNRYFTVEEILNMLQKITGKKKIKIKLPLWFASLTAPLAETYYKMLRQPPLFTKYSICTLNSNALFSHLKATTEFGYSTRDMRQTLYDTVNWLKSKGRL